MSQVTDEQVYRLVAAIFPTKTQKIISELKTRIWAFGETGVPGYIGDRLDDLELFINTYRARKMIHRDQKLTEGQPHD